MDLAVLEFLLPGAVDRLTEVQKAIDADLKPRSFEIPGVRVALKVVQTPETVTVGNVVGYLAGRDPELKDEVVVLGAHYDHEGMRDGRIFFGADDNASGTTALVAVAEAFGRSPIRPRRSVIVAAFAGEERGLLGSRAYTLAPPVPLERTVAMINMDMVGRNKTDEITVIGGDFSPELKTLAEEEAPGAGLKAAFESGSRQGLIRRSDQAAFYDKGIPVLFFFSGFHPDYHQVTDTPDKMDPEKLARVSRLAFAVAWRVAERTSRPTFRKAAPSSGQRGEGGG
jgi:Zn-dependent M28 family amino/carboxypeptidase